MKKDKEKIAMDLYMEASMSVKKAMENLSKIKEMSGDISSFGFARKIDFNRPILIMQMVERSINIESEINSI